MSAKVAPTDKHNRQPDYGLGWNSSLSENQCTIRKGTFARLNNPGADPRDFSIFCTKPCLSSITSKTQSIAPPQPVSAPKSLPPESPPQSTNIAGRPRPETATPTARSPEQLHDGNRTSGACRSGDDAPVPTSNPVQRQTGAATSCWVNICQLAAASSARGTTDLCLSAEPLHNAPNRHRLYHATSLSRLRKPNSSVGSCGGGGGLHFSFHGKSSQSSH